MTKSSDDSKGTDFETQCDILADLWMQYRFDSKFKDFVEYNDLGLPLAFLISEDLVAPKPLAKNMVGESFELLLTALGISDDPGFDSLDEVLVGE